MVTASGPREVELRHSKVQRAANGFFPNGFFFFYGVHRGWSGPTGAEGAQNVGDIGVLKCFLRHLAGIAFVRSRGLESEKHCLEPFRRSYIVTEAFTFQQSSLA